MITFRYILFALCFGLSVLSADYVAALANDNLDFLTIDENMGLSQNNVRAIAKDKYGFVWIGTKNGLNRFDGSKISEIECADLEKGISDHTFSTLLTDDDGNLWIGTDSGLFVYDAQSGNIRYFDAQDSNGYRIDSWVGELKRYKDAIWVSESDNGLFRIFDGKLQHFPLTNSLTGVSDMPSHIAIDEDGNPSVGTWEKGLYTFDPDNRTFKHHTSDKNGNSFIGLKISGVAYVGDKLYISTQEGDIYEFDPKNDLLTHCHTLPSIVRTLTHYKTGLLAGTYEGVYYFDCISGKKHHYRHNPLDRFSLGDNIIYSVYCDDDGGLWIGTLFGGVSYHLKETPDFEKVQIQDISAQMISSDCIRGLAVDNSNRLWIGTENRGLIVLNLNNGSYRTVGDTDNTVLNVYAHGDMVYAGLFDKGLLIIDRHGMTRKYSGESLGVKDSSVFAFFIDSNGERWLGNSYGLFHAPENSLSFIPVPELKDTWVHDITTDKDGNLYISTMHNGAWKIDRNRKNIDRFPMDSTGGFPLENVQVSSITIAGNNDVFISTDGFGLFMYSPRTKTLQTFDSENNLPDNVIYKAVEDKQNHLWFGTNKGLVSLDPLSKAVRIFTTHSCLPENQFNYSSAVTDSLGNVYLGSVKGLIRFNPESVSPIPDKVNGLYITRMTIDGKAVESTDKDCPYVSNILETEALTLKPHQSNISLEISMPNLLEAGLNRYYYKLTPLDSEWLPARNGLISFSRLASGNYTLEIKGVDAFGREVEKSVRIKALAPWYLTCWAILAYLIAGIVAIFAGIRLYLRHKSREIHEQQRIVETKREMEVYKSKIDFFTEVSHEIRTPLTLISAPLESMKNPAITQSELQYNIKLIDRNTNRLLELVSQLLNFEKLSKNRYELKLERIDISDLVKENVERFMPEASRRHIVLEAGDIDNIISSVDREAFIKILSNLLSNGIKYARSRVSVSLRGEGTDQFSLRVFSDGDSIDESMREKIFEAFYRMSSNKDTAEGIGLGLPLARLLAELHGGALRLMKEAADGNTFELRMPLDSRVADIVCDKTSASDSSVDTVESTQPQFQDDSQISDDTSVAMSSSADSDEIAIKQNAKRYHILIVEDNDDMREFIKHSLCGIYDVTCAVNGRDGLDAVRNHNIDLIISDVMMPVMDGLDMCRYIKADTEYCHIPIIFLTAKNDINLKIQGLSSGAESFIEKPFSVHHLKSQIYSLLDNRRREREKYLRQPFYRIDNIPGNNLDEAFMEKATNYIIEHISEEELNVEKMGEVLCLSRSALYRKIKQVFEMSPVEFIRSIRLKKAAELIASGQYKIYEICYMVGISSPSYFSRIFQKQFGIPPKEFESKYVNKQ